MFKADRYKTTSSLCKKYCTNKAGKEVLIKSVVQSIPMHAMSIFKLPVSICKAIEQRIASFFNYAMLGKQVWRLSTSPSALWSRVLKGIYFPTGDLWTASTGLRPSWGWRSLLIGRDTYGPSSGALLCPQNSKLFFGLSAKTPFP